MKFPCEMIAEPYLAELRRSIAQKLKAQNLTQVEIASLLNVTQPVVSGYLKRSRHHNNPISAPIVEEARNRAKIIVPVLLEQGRDGIETAINLACESCKIMRQSGPTCKFHRAHIETLSDDCNSCLSSQELIQLQIDKEQLIYHLNQLYSHLSGKENLTRIIPEIGMQIVAGTAGITSISDIAGFSGRINKRKENVPLAATPTFGSSETTSELMILLQQKWDIDVAAIAAVKTNDWLINRLTSSDYTIIRQRGFDTDHQSGLESIGDFPAPPFAIVDTGSVGLEPISYLCNSSLSDLQEYLLNIL